MTDATAKLRQNFYLLLGIVAVSIATARVVGVENVWEPSRYKSPTESGFANDRIDAPYKLWPAVRPEPTPMYGSNDKSRFLTVRAIVDHGTFVIGHRDDRDDPKTDRGLLFEDGWFTQDKVMNPDTGDYYSSKPPLYAVMLAGEYWVLKHAFGLSMVRDRWPVVIIILLTVNVLPFAICLVLFGRLIEQYGRTDFGKLLAFMTACVGTFLTTFASTLNNHSPGAYCVVFAIYPLLRTDTPTRCGLFVSGFFASLTATFDLPAASFTAALVLTTLLAVKGRVIWMLLGTLLPVAAFFGANYAALGQFRPAYSDFGGPWYNYPGSHWLKLELAKTGAIVPGIDFAQEGRVAYLFHCLLGHHGWFSLTPVWCIGMLGIAVTWRQALQDLKSKALSLPLACLFALALTVTLTVFFVFIQKTNNYGGNTSGLRWFFWLTPIWVLATLAGADRIASKWGQRGAAVLLGFSVLSVFYPAWNPWRSPWLLVAMERLEWVNYDRLK
ncbi:hypothetical protein BH11PLA2_BH11PLA2_01320 [soil metagenome]